MGAWQGRCLEDLEVVHLWADGIYIKADLEKAKAVVLVVLTALSDGTRVMVLLTSGYRESTENWSEVLRDLKQRGMGYPSLVIADVYLGIRGALCNVYPQAEEQRCWNHRIVNGLAKIPKSQQQAALLMLRQITRRDTPGGGAPERKISAVLPEERIGCSGQSDRSGLGSDGDVLQRPRRAVATSADHQSGGGVLFRSATVNRSCSEVQRKSPTLEL
jgi:hypothetical protein